MARYLDPKADLTFKRIFSQHPKLLKSFLNAVLPFEPDRFIEEVEYLPSEMAPDSPGRKYSIVDVRCKDNSNRQFIVEMQSTWEEGFMSRILFNAGKAYVQQLGKRQDYELLQPVYTLAILSRDFDHESDRFFHHYKIVNIENTDAVIEGLEFVLVELTEKFRPETMTDRRLAVLWLRFLKEVGENMRSLPPEMQENEEIRLAAELCEEGGFTPAELAAYDKYWDMLRTELTAFKGASKRGQIEGEAIGLEKGKAIGLEEGKTIGLEEGKTIGLKEGKAIGLKEGEALGAKKEKEQFVIKSYKTGLSLETISSLTGLTQEQITKILEFYELIS
jgi:conserved hypothetical protein (putative transposase or invertase)